MRGKTLVTAWDRLTPQDRHIIADCVAFEMAKLFEGREIKHAEASQLVLPADDVTFRL
jgi:hypothetical protein